MLLLCRGENRSPNEHGESNFNSKGLSPRIKKTRYPAFSPSAVKPSPGEMRTRQNSRKAAPRKHISARRGGCSESVSSPSPQNAVRYHVAKRVYLVWTWKAWRGMSKLMHDANWCGWGRGTVDSVTSALYCTMEWIEVTINCVGTEWSILCRIY